MQETIKAGYQSAFELVSELRQASLFDDYRDFDASVGIDRLWHKSVTHERREAAAEAIVDSLWEKMIGMRPAFESMQPMREFSYAAVGPCRFRVGDYWAAFKAAMDGQQVQPVLPTTDLSGDYWAEATLTTVSHQTRHWLMQVLVCYFQEPKAQVIGTHEFTRWKALREICPFTSALDSLLRERLMHEQSQLLRDSFIAFPQTIGTLQSTSQRKPNGKIALETEKSTDEMLLSFLCKWHGYETDAFKADYVGVRRFSNWVAEQAEGKTPCSRNTVSIFFDNVFGGHDKYKMLCRNKGIETRLAAVKGDLAKRMHQQLNDSVGAAEDAIEVDE